MTKTISLVLGALALIACASHSTDAGRAPISINAEARDFVDALIRKDEAELSARYLNNAPSFTKHGKLNRDIYDFLFTSDPNTGKQSVQEIIGSGEYVLKIIPQSSAVYTVLIAPVRNKERLNNLSFLRSAWMVEYIACEFEVSRGKISLYQNVCFAETDGPFPYESN